ncbi:MAG: aminotransferase class I/II-fold pyridoxal phosphate-dependent enzyme [Pseudomonadota bacterium]
MTDSKPGQDKSSPRTAGQKMSREERAALVAKMMAKKSVGSTASPAKTSSFDWAALPEIKKAALQKKVAQSVGVGNPYMRHTTNSGAAVIEVEGRPTVNFCSYDYISVGQHPDVIGSAHAAVDHYGTSANASRLVSGERTVHGELEAALAENYGQEAAMVLVSGHATNVNVLTHLFGPKDLIVMDSLAHNSIYVGGQRSSAARRTFPHNDMNALDELLHQVRGQFDKCIVVVEGLYSMDGDCAPLEKLTEIKRRHRTLLMVDEAHGLGVLGKTGRGSFEAQNVDPKLVDIWMGTLSKTLCGAGGYLAGCETLIEYLKLSLPGFVFSVGLSPVLAAANLAALRAMQNEPERVERLQANGRFFTDELRRHGVDTGFSEGHAVVAAITGSSLVALKSSQALLERGYYSLPIITPAVEERKARLRFFLQSDHTQEQLAGAALAAAETMDMLRAEAAQ